MSKSTNKALQAVLVLGLLTAVPLAAAASNIASGNKWAWSENAGWFNFRPTYGGVIVHATHLSGYAWGENVGWIKLGANAGGPYSNTNPTDWGVNRDVAGNLSGYAWSENVGWVNFNPPYSQVTIDPLTGFFDGYGWGENIGWVHFRNPSVPYAVRFLYPRPPTSVDAVPPPGICTNDNTIDVCWSGAVDRGVGIDYCYAWDTSTGTVPNCNRMLGHNSDPHCIEETLPDGDNHYFHLRTCDTVGNCAAQLEHMGPFLIDTAPPVWVGPPSSRSHDPGIPSNDNTIEVTWPPVTDPGCSGVDGYAYEFNQSQTWTCDKIKDLEAHVTSVPGPPLSDGTWYFHICAGDKVGNWSQVQTAGPYVIDTNPPTNPTVLKSTSHNVAEWSNDDTIDFEWTGATDPKGVAGYSVVCDRTPDTLPDETVDVPHTADPHRYTCGPVADGDDHYFHLRTCDQAGNCAAALHLGSFWIDTTAPAWSGPPTSPSHDPGTPSNDNTIDVTWPPVTDTGGSGVDGYAYEFNQSQTWTCDQNKDLDADPPVTSDPLSDGEWYFHICAGDKVGNWSDVQRAGSYVIDTTPPTNPTVLKSTSHKVAEWSNDDTIDFEWSGATDPKGVAGYSVVCDRTPDTLPDETVDVPHTSDPHRYTCGPLADGDNHYFHLRTCDTAGNCAAALHRGEFWIDATPPTEPQSVRSPSHAPGTPSTNDTVVILWNSATDALSGMAGYGYEFNHFPTWTCDDRNFLAEPVTEIVEQLGENTWYFHICARDKAGNWSQVVSAGPYIIYLPGPNQVETLILANPVRMGLSLPQTGELLAKLDELARHDRVRGRLVNLGFVADLEALYSSWDSNLDPDFANYVLFGCHGDPLPAVCDTERNGIHDLIRDLLDLYPAVEYLVLVGGDYVIPMGRMKDRTGLLESYYDGLTPDGTTVGRALHAERYLSDDPLATEGTIRPEDLLAGNNLFIPDLAVGRLVETPDEIAAAIDTFVARDGVLDLSALDPETGHKALVTGYDFLIDSAKAICRDWKSALGIPETHDDPLAPVDCQLISRTWGKDTVEERRIALRDHLAGNGGERYGVMSINGHGTHFQLGVPSGLIVNIQGLHAVDVYGSDDCGTPTLGALELGGGVLYAVGCHGGLPVPGTCATDGDHSLDLPQTMLASGVMAYVANSGYGWGLLHGIGLSERMVEILTEELTRGGPVVVGDSVRKSKLRYFLETYPFDAYDAKTSMQWIPFGFPMYEVWTGIPDDGTAGAFAGPARQAGERPAVERFGGVTVERRLSGLDGAATAGLPDNLSVLRLNLNLNGYTKHSAEGEPLPRSEPGCPAPPPDEPEGCYYRLNGLATGEADLPIQPYFVYDSRLSGTSQHGALWLGGSYGEENQWEAVIAQLVSNNGPYSEYGDLPEVVYLETGTPTQGTTGPQDDCRPTDLEASSLVVQTGELRKANPNDETHTIQRIFHEIDLEVLYFNGSGNCDRIGPYFTSSAHEVTGSTIEWTIEAYDEAGVWRVVVVYDDQTQQRWVPVDLTDDGTGTWTGSLRATGMSQLTWFVQAVDMRGNVSWVEPPAHLNIAPGTPWPFQVTIEPGEADLTVCKTAAPDPVMAEDPLTYAINVSNLGPDAADGVVVTDGLPDGVTYSLSGGPGWSCAHATGTVICSRDIVELGAAPPITILVTAPEVGGTITNTVQVSAQNDPNPLNNSCTVETVVIDDTMTDLAIVKEDGGVVAVPGEPITYSITVANHGPNPVIGAEVTDVFPPELEAVTWTCLWTVGSQCTANGFGNISDTVNLLPLGTLIYMATATVAQDAVGPIENTATVSVPPGMRDFVPGNDSSTVITPVEPEVPIFADGFESGDLSAWSAVTPAAVIEVRDQTPQGDGRYLARFTLNLGALEKSGDGTVLVVDQATSQPVLALGLMRKSGQLALLGRLRNADGSEIDLGEAILGGRPRQIEVEWEVSEGVFELRLDGEPRWTASSGQRQE